MLQKVNEPQNNMLSKSRQTQKVTYDFISVKYLNKQIHGDRHRLTVTLGWE